MMEDFGIHLYLLIFLTHEFNLLKQTGPLSVPPGILVVLSQRPQ